MNLNHFEATALVQKLAYVLARGLRVVDVSIHPLFTDIRTVQTWFRTKDLALAIGAQNCHWEAEGPTPARCRRPCWPSWTWPTSSPGTPSAASFGETDETVNLKVRAILAAGMTPILCVGETLDEREAGTTEAKVTGQVEAGLAGLSPEQVGGWSSPTSRSGPSARAGRPPEDAQVVCATVRSTVASVVGGGAGRRCASSTAARSSPRTPPTSWRAPTSTGRWWAGPASTPTRSRASSATADRSGARRAGTVDSAPAV